MKVYVGQSRARSLIASMTALGWGEMVTPSELPARRRPWAYDNGAFGAWRGGRPFDGDAFLAGFEHFLYDEPDFIVCPDKVAAGEESLRFSLDWRVKLRGVGPLYLAVQDGMTEASVERALEVFDGIFVGGTLAWKVRTGRRWVKLAEAAGKPCHVGRVGTMMRVRWARRIGASSIDSSLPLWSALKFDRFRRALETPLHPELFAPGELEA